MTCKNCGKEYEPKKFKTIFCSVKCSNLFTGKQKNPVYLLVGEYKKFDDIPEKIIKKLYSFDTYDVSKSLKIYGLDEILNEYRNFKNTHKLCSNCNNFYNVKHPKSGEMCPNENCKSYNLCKKEKSIAKNAETKLKNHGDSKYNNREKFKETYKTKTPEEIELWNAHRSKALQKSADEWSIIVKKREKTYQNKTGFKNPFQNPEVLEKIKQTNIKKYGTENPLQNEEIKNKLKNTEFKKYGGSHNSKEECKNKVKSTVYKKYGVSNISQSLETKEKIKATNLKNYGVEHVSQSSEIKEKIKATNLKNYGAESHTQSPVWKARMKENYREKYGVEFAPRKHLTNLKEYNNKEFWISEFGEYRNNILCVDFDKIYNEFGILAHSTVYNKLKSFELEFKKKSNYGKLENEFLDELSHFLEIDIKRQYPIKPFNFKVDGYIENTNFKFKSFEFTELDKVVVEFLGDYWHGKLNNSEMTYFGESFADLHKRTFERFNKIKNAGYRILYIWESDYGENGISSVMTY